MAMRNTATIVLFVLTARYFRPSPALAAEADVLHAGTSNPGRVYAYRGSLSWEPISETLGYAVLDLIEFGNHLYAATMSASDPLPSVGSVWRCDPGNAWTPVTTNMDDEVCDLIEWNGNLYAGTAWWGGKMYLLNSETDQFEFLDYVDGWSGIRAMYVWKQPWIQLGDIWWDKFGRYDGTATYDDVNFYGSCVYDFASYGNALYAAAFMGRLFRSEDGIIWSVVKDYGDDNLWELESFGGRLYMADNNGLLWRMTASHRRTKVWTAPDGIISMLADGEEMLYFGTGGEAGALYQSSTEGDGCVYAYSGTGTPELISGALGTGVQCLYKTAPSAAEPGPAASTLSATRIGQTSATLRGKIVEDRGESCQCRFRYWKRGDTTVSNTVWTGEFTVGDVFSQAVAELVPGSEYYFWAEARNSLGQTGWDSELEPFTTLAGPVELCAPNGGELLSGGSTATIEWRADPSVSDVLVECSLDGGATWSSLAMLANARADYQCLWDVPMADSQQCLICVSDASDPNVNDVSDDNFSISTLVVPEVRAMAQMDAETAISAGGLAVGTVTYLYSGTTPAGSVASQRPLAGTPASAGSAVDLVVSAGPEATAAPAVETEAAIDVGSKQATLGGKITDDGGGGCQYRFCYWKSGNMWINHSSWEGYVGNGQRFSQIVTGLNPSSTYHFWAEARNSAGASGGWDSGIESLRTKD